MTRIGGKPPMKGPSPIGGDNTPGKVIRTAKNDLRGRKVTQLSSFQLLDKAVRAAPRPSGKIAPFKHSAKKEIPGKGMGTLSSASSTLTGSRSVSKSGSLGKVIKMAKHGFRGRQVSHLSSFQLLTKPLQVASKPSGKIGKLTASVKKQSSVKNIKTTNMAWSHLKNVDSRRLRG